MTVQQINPGLSGNQLKELVAELHPTEHLIEKTHGRSWPCTDTFENTSTTVGQYLPPVVLTGT